MTDILHLNLYFHVSENLASDIFLSSELSYDLGNHLTYFRGRETFLNLYRDVWELFDWF